MNTASCENTYDKVPYPNWTHRGTHPRQLEAIATLFGMQPVAITDCRVLEIGCASGSNILPMARDLPGSTFVGLDLSAVQITDAKKLAAEAGIQNVRFEQSDILTVDDSWGRFDYIVCHGIYSWVPDNVKEKILAICKNNLAAGGVAMVSYNVYPGWHFRRMIRDMMLYHVSGREYPRDQITQSRAMLEFLRDNCAPNTAYGTVLKHEMGEIKPLQDAQLFHDYLEPVNDPVYFHEFAARSQAAGLQYLGDVDFSRMLAKFLPKKARDALTGLSMMQQEQYMDFLRNRSFRRTLLCHDDVALNRDLQADIMRKFHFRLTALMPEDQIDLASDEPVSIKSEEHKISSGEPVVKASLQQLARQWPGTLSFGDLHSASLKALPTGKLSDRSNENERGELNTENTLASSLMACLGARLVDAWVHPPKPLPPVGEKPVASSLVRAQARLGNMVSNFRHEQVLLDDAERHLIRLLDGQHDRKTLIDNLRFALASGAMVIRTKGEALKEVSGEHLTSILDEALSRLHRAALLDG